ncbi:hypothetical protein GJ496_003640, partial [Pomphorhynchus laevis]
YQFFIVHNQPGMQHQKLII